MLERWRKPLGVVYVDDSNEATETLDGRVFRMPNFFFDAESVERLRLGYACVKCMEVFEQPWPERCNSCGAPIRKEQSAYFEREFSGEVLLGSSHSLEDELGLLREYEGGEEDSP
jgi:DNA-directed RNA polymerase subunit N (RpoN/RPB10)